MKRVSKALLERLRRLEQHQAANIDPTRGMTTAECRRELATLLVRVSGQDPTAEAVSAFEDSGALAEWLAANDPNDPISFLRSVQGPHSPELAVRIAHENADLRTRDPKAWAERERAIAAAIAAMKTVVPKSLWDRGPSSDEGDRQQRPSDVTASVTGSEDDQG